MRFFQVKASHRSIGRYIFLTLMVASTSFAGAPDPAGEEMVEKVHEAELKVSVAKSQEARLGAIKDLQKYLEDAIAKLPAKNADEHDRRLRASLFTIQDSLVKMDIKNFDPKKCAQYRAHILQGFGPHGEMPAYVPGEAREVLKLLAGACAQPGLAEIPGSKQGPPPTH